MTQKDTGKVITIHLFLLMIKCLGSLCMYRIDYNCCYQKRLKLIARIDAKTARSRSYKYNLILKQPKLKTTGIPGL